jgi:hypothetical protein
MYVDYVRVYQRDDAPGIGCSPEDYPTEDYIQKYEFLSFHFHPSKLTRRQPFKCLHESQSHNVEPSRVLLPPQLDIQWLLDPYATASGYSGFILFSHERHDMLRSLAQVLKISFVNLVVTEPHLPSFHHTPRPYRQIPRHPRYLRPPHHRMRHSLHISTFKHPCIVAVSATRLLPHE